MSKLMSHGSTLITCTKNHTCQGGCCGKILQNNRFSDVASEKSKPYFLFLCKVWPFCLNGTNSWSNPSWTVWFLPKRFADTNHGVAGTNSSTWPNSLAVPNNWSLMLRVKSSNKSSASTCQRLIGENQLYTLKQNTTVIWNIVMASTYHQSTELGTAPVRWRSCHVNTRSKPSVWSMKFKAAHVVAKTWNFSRLQA